MRNLPITVLPKVRANETVEPNENPATIGQKDCHELAQENLEPAGRQDKLEKIIERWEAFKIKQAITHHKD